MSNTSVTDFFRTYLIKVCDWALYEAKRDPDISLDDYNKISVEYNKTTSYINNVKDNS